MSHKVNRNKKYFEEYSRTADLSTLELFPFQWIQAIEGAVRSGDHASDGLYRQLESECLQGNRVNIKKHVTSGFHHKITISWKRFIGGLFVFNKSAFGEPHWRILQNINSPEFPEAVRVRAIMISLRGSKANKEKQSNLKITSTFERFMNIKILPET